MEQSILCKTDARGRVVWIAEDRSAFDPHLPGLRERGERYRIVPRTLSVMGGSVQVYAMVLLDGGRDG